MKRQQSTSSVDYQARFEQLQTRFIDEPQEAVRDASTLVREAVDRLFDGEHDTEQLRRVMQGYRDLLARLDGGDGLSSSATGRTTASSPAESGVRQEEMREHRQQEMREDRPED